MTRTDEHLAAVALALAGACAIVALSQCGDVHAQEVERMVQVCYHVAEDGTLHADAAYRDGGQTTARSFSVETTALTVLERAAVSAHGALCVSPDGGAAGRVAILVGTTRSLRRDSWSGTEAKMRRSWRGARR